MSQKLIEGTTGFAKHITKRGVRNLCKTSALEQRIAYGTLKNTTSLPGSYKEEAPMVCRRKIIIITLLTLLLSVVVFFTFWSISPPKKNDISLKEVNFTPPLYTGLDAFRSWDKLSYLELGDRVVGQSTADPGGSNTDNVHSLRTLTGGKRVLFDQMGPGLVTFMRMQQDYGGPWSLYLDGGFQGVISSRDLGQNHPMAPYPLSLSPEQSQGSSIIATAIPFQERMLWVSDHANGNFYAIYRKFPYGTQLPTWGSPRSSDDVVNLLRRSGSDIAPSNISREDGQVDIMGKMLTQITALSGPSQIRALTFRVPVTEMVQFGNARLLIFWDDETTPSVDAPIKFLVGNGAGMYQPVGRQLVNGWIAGTGESDTTSMNFNLYWPMPFRKNARIAIVSETSIERIDWHVRYEPFLDPPNWWGTFHATYTNVPRPTPGQDMTFLDIKGSGRMVGTVINFTAPDATLEGDPHIYLDESQTPQIAVTGTEEWGLGGNYWNRGHQTTLPLGGLPSSIDNPSGTDRDGAALYRFLIADSIPFNRGLIVNWEHGSENQSTYPYRSVVFWYGTPLQTALLTDEIYPLGEHLSHDYMAEGEQTYQLTAAYGYQVHAPLIAMRVNSTKTSASFTMALDPNNVGAFLRRTFNYCIPDQKANIFIDGHFAGIWYSAGASRRIDAKGHQRCWRDEDFPLPPKLTAGKSSIRVQISFVPTVNAPESAWTASRYQLYSFVLPSYEQASLAPGFQTDSGSSIALIFSERIYYSFRRARDLII